MNVNLSNMNNAYRVNQQQMALNILLNGQTAKTNGMLDMYIKSGNTIQDAGLYSSFNVKQNGYISDTLLLLINNDVSKVVKNGEVYEVAGICFTADQIPKIDTSSLSEVKANNNVIDFGKNSYFKYVSSDGVEHPLFTNDAVIGDVHSEHMRGAEYDEALQRYAFFWRYLGSGESVYLGLTYTNDEIRGYMSDAGMETGFFTVKMGDREAVQFYSASTTAGVIHSKERYDSKYEHLTLTGYTLIDYEPGSIFKIGDTEYVLSKNHTLDIPYGEDIYDLQYPENYKFGRKIE